MSLIISVYVNEGIVMASDSRLTLTVPNPLIGPLNTSKDIPFSDTAYKTFLCPNGSGISTCGNASYKSKPIAGFVEQFIRNLSKNTLVSQIPEMLINFFNSLDNNVITIFHVCGYETNGNATIQKAYRVVTGPTPQVQEQSMLSQGAMWDGETIVLSKLIKEQIINPQIIKATNVNIQNVDGSIIKIEKAAIIDEQNLYLCPEAPIAWQFMSLQDAVNFVKFAFQTTIDAMRFQAINKTVGGPIDILIIKPDKSNWLQHKTLK